MESEVLASVRNRLSTDRIRVCGGAVALLSLLGIVLLETFWPVLPLVAAVPPLLQAGRVTRWSLSCGSLLEGLHVRLREGPRWLRWPLLPFTGMSVVALSWLGRVRNDHVRAGLHLGLALAFTVAVVTAVIMVAIAVLYAVMFIFMVMVLCAALLDDSGNKGVAQNRQNPAAQRLRGTRLHNANLFTDLPTDLRITDGGEIVTDCIIGHTGTGYHIAEDGRVIKRGLFDSDTGVRIQDDGRITRKGVFLDDDTGMRIGNDGRVMERGVLFDTPTGERFAK